MSKTRRKAEGGTHKVAGVSDQTVHARTGKRWAEWFHILDEAGARAMVHRDIAAYLRKNHMSSPWWSQMVAVAYEQERGLRDKNQKPTGYEISRSKTVDVSVSKLYDAWKDVRIRRQWLNETDLVIRTDDPGKSLRLTWSDGETLVAVDFHDRGKGKSQVTVQHGKLKNPEEGERMGEFWGQALDRLEETLGT
jgi:uncharacterized protein YndB with AHSA1/START domain